MAVIAPDYDMKQQIRINAGALKAVAPFWPAAGIGHQQITSVAQKIYVNRKDTVREIFWGDFIDDDFMSGLIEKNISFES
jgi:hypothetical protein